MRISSNQLTRILLTIPIVALFILLFIDVGYDYIYTIHQQSPSAVATSVRYYSDLNSDGYSDKVSLYMPSVNTTSIQSYTHKGELIDQYNFRGIFIKKSQVFFTDYNSDGFKEAVVFTHSGDSVFINMVEPYKADSANMISAFVSLAALEDGEAKYKILCGPTEDVNNDGYREIYFTIHAAFAKQPRNLFYYDVVNNRVKRSPFSGTGFRHQLEAGDIDNDGYIELWGDIGASGNYNEPVPFTDNKTWLKVLSHELEFEFEPAGFAEYPAFISPAIYEPEGKKFILAYLKYKGNNKAFTDALMLFDINGNLLKKVTPVDLDLNYFDQYLIVDEIIYLYSFKDGKILMLNEQLNITGVVKKKFLFNSSGPYGPYNFDSENKTEIAFLRNNSLYFYNLKGRQLTKTVLNMSGTVVSEPVIIDNYDGFSGFQLKTANYHYLISTEKRNKWLVYSLKVSIVIIVIYMLVYLIQYFQKVQDKKRQAYEKDMKELQLLAIKKQINPHFIFNALNSISAMNLKGNTDEADDYLVSFSQLIREVVNSSDKNIVSIKNEIGFIKKYLELECLRLGPDFKFKINIPENCLDVPVPSMSLHIFIENAIKHGFAYMEGKKELYVNAQRNDKNIEISITDNGVGFDSTKTGNSSTGKGLEIIKKMFSAYENLTAKKITYSKLKPESGGTSIRIQIEV